MAQPRSDNYKARHLPACKRLPLAPLLTILGTSAACHVSHDNWQRWLARGVSLQTADRMSVKLAGKHPWEIWGDEWWEDVLPSIQEVTK